MHESEKKLAKRKHLMVELGEIYEDATWHRWAESKVGCQSLILMVGVKHKRNSTQPEGTMRQVGWSRDGLTIRWRYDYKRESYYAPTVEHFDLTNRTGCDLMTKVIKVFEGAIYFDTTPEQFIEKLGALVVVEPIRGDDGYSTDDYHVLRIPGESPLMTLARQAD